MQTDRFDFLRKQFSSFEIKLSEDCNTVEIVNPFGNENVKVEYVPEDDFTPYIVYFAFQHCHMCDEEDIIDYINNIINGNVFSIEYFNNDTRCFGGDITAEELKNLSYDTLEQNTGYYGITKLKDCADSFKLRGWHNDYNFDATFVTNEDGSITIKKFSKIETDIAEKFNIAAKEFKFNFVSPYCIGKNHELCFFGYLFKENFEKGVVIDIICDFEEINIEKWKYCKEKNLFYSCLDIKPLLGEYNHNYFSEMIKDWKYEF